MAETPWHDVVELVAPYVMRIWTPQGSGTGFLVSNSKNTPLCGIATAEHVISHAHYWQEPIRIEHQVSGKTMLVHVGCGEPRRVPRHHVGVLGFQSGRIKRIAINVMQKG